MLFRLLLSTGYPKALKGEAELLEKAREVIPISDSENTEIIIAGTSVREDSVLMWFISGNEYQTHYYLPIEFKASKDSSYTFVKKYLPLKCGMSIVALNWKSGTSFIINNPKCNILRITDTSGTHDETITEYPYVVYNTNPVTAYVLLDSYGNEM